MVDYPNIFALGQDAFNNAYAGQKRVGQDMASRQAGEAIAGGDYTAGANVFNRAGMIDQAHNVVADQQVLQDRQTAATNLAQDRATKLAAQKAEAFGKLANVAATVPQGQRLPWLQQHVQDLSTLGIPAEQIARLTEDDLSDQNLASFRAAVAKAAEPYTLGEGQKRFDGQNKEVAAGAPKPQEYVVLPEGGVAIPKPSNGATLSNPAPGISAPTPSAAPSGAGAPRGVRNNNPLNLTSPPQGQWDGQTGTDGRYATFATPQAGIAAADKNLQAYATRHGINTLAGVITRWSPPSENDTQGYIATVAKDLNVDPNQPLNLSDPRVRAVVLHSMSKVELGTPSGAPLGAPQAPAAVAAATQPGEVPGTLHGAPKPKPAPSGYQWNAKGTLEAIPGGPADPGGLGAAGAGGSLHGAEYLTTLPPTQAQQVKAIAEGRMQFPSGFALKTPYWQQMISAVSQYDPSFDAVNYNARAKTRADFTSGKNAQNIKALNTAIGHLGRLDSQIAGTSGIDGIPFATDINKGINWFEQHQGDPGVTNFNQTASALSTELTAVFRGTGGAEADVKRYLDQLNSNASTRQKKEAVKNIAELLNSRLEAVGSQYNQGMGTTEDPITLLNPQAASTFQKLSGRRGIGAAASSKVIRYNAQGERVQ